MAANKTDPLRHMSVFNPDTFGDRRVDIIGCGATGSRIAMEIAKLGVTNLHLHDFDKIEAHNCANQLFGINDVGKLKVDALADRILADTGLEVTKHPEAVTGRSELGNVVFLLTDTMKSRKEIWEGAIRFHPMTEIMIETRMGASEGRVYIVRPCIPGDIRFWESTLCDDDEAAESLCGARTSVGPTAALIHAHAVWSMIRWFANAKDAEKHERPQAEAIFYADPPMVMTRQAGAF